jgi:periplasmic protein TonB
MRFRLAAAVTVAACPWAGSAAAQGASAGPYAAPSPPSSVPTPGDYDATLRTWLEAHKVYPEEARQLSEEGSAVLRFSVDRSGHVLDYAVVSSTGYSDLDQSLENMMRGATLPAFPPNMAEPEIEVTVTIRFGAASKYQTPASR